MAVERGALRSPLPDPRLDEGSCRDAGRHRSISPAGKTGSLQPKGELTVASRAQPPMPSSFFSSASLESACDREIASRRSISAPSGVA